jgi:hypothetical protein
VTASVHAADKEKSQDLKIDNLASVSTLLFPLQMLVLVYIHDRHYARCFGFLTPNSFFFNPPPFILETNQVTYYQNISLALLLYHPRNSKLEYGLIFAKGRLVAESNLMYSKCLELPK